MGNIIKNKTLEQYKQKYHVRNEYLYKFSKKEVEEFDKTHKSIKGKNSLLGYRKWWLIDDTYYEIPRAPRYTWFRNLNKYAQIGTGAFVVIGLATATALGIVFTRPVKSLDEAFVNNLNDYIKDDIKNIKTTHDAIDYLKNKKQINLEEETAKENNHEYAFDIESRSFLVLNSNDGSVFYTPHEIKTKSSVFRIKDDYVYNSRVQNPREEYGTYIKTKVRNSSNKINRSKLKYTYSLNESNEDDSLTFNTSIDVGYNQFYKLTFKRSSIKAKDFKPIVVTNRNDLEINGNVDSISHYGVATSLSVDKLDGTYNEYGSVDGGVTLKSAVNFVVNEGSEINSITVADKDATVEAKKDSYVGTVAITEEVQEQGKTVQDIISKSDPESIEEKKDDPVPEAKEFDGGFGTEVSPYSISSAENLVEMADKVNVAESTYAEKHYRITKDINLETVENFTPIGNAATPFKGKVDGCNHKISNMNITSNDSNLSLFGYTTGKANSAYKNKEDVYRNCEFYQDNITEDKYDCVIKNLVMENVSITVDAAQTSYKQKQASAFIGIAHNTRADNLHLLSGNIIGNKAAGGIVGSLNDSVLLNSSTSEEVTVTGAEYNNGGVVGAMSYTAGLQVNGTGVFNCVNKATVINLNNKTNNTGYSGGVVGFASGSGGPSEKEGVTHRGNHIIGCINYGTVMSNNVDTTKKCEYLGGVLGYGGAAIELIADSTNEGTVINNGDSAIKGISGVVSYTSGEITNCINKGTIKGKSEYKAGVIAVNHNNGYFPFTIDNCSNVGVLTDEGGVITDIANGILEVNIKNQTFKDVNDLAKSIHFYNVSEGGWYYTASFTNTNVLDASGTYEIPSHVKNLSITSDKKIFDSIKIHENVTSLTIDAPMGSNIELDNAPNAYITIKSKNTTVTVKEGATIKHLIITEEGSSIVNNGTINGVEIKNKASKLVNNENATLNSFSVNHCAANNNVEFINKGTFTTNNVHCLDVDYNDGDVNFVVKNYGTITCDATNNAVWFILLYSTGTFDFTNFNGSKIELKGKMYPSVAHEGMTGTIKYQSGATYSRESGSTTDWQDLKINGKIDVIPID